jgi:hypothetical protein
VVVVLLMVLMSDESSGTNESRLLNLLMSMSLRYVCDTSVFVIYSGSVLVLFTRFFLESEGVIGISCLGTFLRVP